MKLIYPVIKILKNMFKTKKKMLTRQQHYVPQSYLKLWYNSKSSGDPNYTYTWYFDFLSKGMERSRKIDSDSIIKIGFENYFYEEDKNNPTNEFEDWFHQGENELGKFFGNLDGNFNYFTEEFAKNLVKALVSLPYRTKTQLDFIYSILDESERRKALLNMQNQIKLVQSRYSNVGLFIYNYTAESNLPMLYTCDNPLIEMSTMRDNAILGILPIGERRALIMISKTEKLYSYIKECGDLLVNLDTFCLRSVSYSKLLDNDKIFQKIISEISQNIDNRARHWVLAPHNYKDKLELEKKFTKHEIEKKKKADRLIFKKVVDSYVIF